MKEYITQLKDKLDGKVPPGTARSSHWPTVRKHHLAGSPECAVCGSRKSLQVHHKRPFHLHPELELDPTNLVTLCESGTNCHLNYGHAGDFRGVNPDVEQDVASWKAKFEASRTAAKKPDDSTPPPAQS